MPTLITTGGAIVYPTTQRNAGNRPTTSTLFRRCHLNLSGDIRTIIVEAVTEIHIIILHKNHGVSIRVLLLLLASMLANRLDRPRAFNKIFTAL